MYANTANPFLCCLSITKVYTKYATAPANTKSKMIDTNLISTKGEKGKYDSSAKIVTYGAL